MENFRIHLGSINHVPLGHGRRFTIGVHQIMVFRSKLGRLFAIENYCPTHGSIVSDPNLSQDVFQCPLHGHSFDFILGEWSGEGDGRCVKTLKVWEENGRIVVLFHFPIKDTTMRLDHSFTGPGLKTQIIG